MFWPLQDTGWDCHVHFIVQDRSGQGAEKRHEVGCTRIRASRILPCVANSCMDDFQPPFVAPDVRDGAILRLHAQCCRLRLLLSADRMGSIMMAVWTEGWDGGNADRDTSLKGEHAREAIRVLPPLGRGVRWEVSGGGSRYCSQDDSVVLL